MGQGYIDVPLTPRQRPQAVAQGYEDVPIGAPESRAVLPSRPVAPVAGRGSNIDLARSYDAAGGVRAGAASTVYGGGDLIRRATGMDRVIDQPDVRAAMTPPDSPAGRAGFAAEQFAEFAIPMARVASAVKGAPLAVRALTEGAASGSIAAAQGGDPVSGVVIGAAAPAVGALVRAPLVDRAAGALREGAEKRIAQALGATKERFKAMAEKLAPQMLDRGVPGRVGASREGLLKQARSQASTYGRAIDEALMNAGDEPVSTRLIIDALEEAKSAFQVPQRMSVQDATRRGLTAQARDVGGGFVEVPVVIDARPIEQLQQLQQTLGQLGDDATVGQIVAIRRVWDDVVSRAGGFQHRSSRAFGVPLAEQTEAWAKREATSAIRKVLAESQPDLAALNKEFAFWSSLREVLTATQKRTQAQQGGLGKMILGGAGVTAGAMSGNTTSDRMQNAIIGGLIGKQLIAAVTSPRWRFVSVDVRNRLANAIATKNEGETLSALVRASAALGSGGALRPAPSH